MKSPSIPLFCKTYSGDINRFRRLLSSIDEFNRDSLLFVVSVPRIEIPLFRNVVGSDCCQLICDEDVLSLIPNVTSYNLKTLDGGLIQQIVKSEFWRFTNASSYVCIDADSFFIRDFFLSDFITDVGAPFSVVHECKEYLQTSVNRGRDKVLLDFRRDSSCFKEIFSRAGPDYDFGPTPVVWSRKVWSELSDRFIEPRGWNMVDAIKRYPAELRWYGEALLKYRPIPIEPKEPLFRVYHSEWQYRLLSQMGESLDRLKENYLGVVLQSNWDKDLDYGASRKPLSSRVFSRLRRAFFGAR
jgi:hypothetical protein